MPRDSPLDDTGAQLLFGPWPSPTNDRPRCRLAVGRSGPGAGLCSADCRLPGRPAAAPLPRRHHQRGRATAIRPARRRGGAPDQPIETQLGAGVVERRIPRLANPLRRWPSGGGSELVNRSAGDVGTYGGDEPSARAAAPLPQRGVAEPEFSRQVRSTPSATDVRQVERDQEGLLLGGDDPGAHPPGCLLYTSPEP